jgi:hypothetical protein
VIAHLQQQHPRLPNGSRQQGSSMPAAVQELLSTLLLLWHIMFTSAPCTKPLASNAAAACASEAAELALLLLLTCDFCTDAAQLSESRFTKLQGEAAFALHVLADALFHKGGEVETDAGSSSPGPHTLALVSDSVQEALTLHLAILLTYHHQQAAGRSSSSGTSSTSSSSSSSTNSLLAAASEEWLQPAGSCFLQGRLLVWRLHKKKPHDHIAASWRQQQQQQQQQQAQQRRRSTPVRDAEDNPGSSAAGRAGAHSSCCPPRLAAAVQGPDRCSRLFS